MPERTPPDRAPRKNPPEPLASETARDGPTNPALGPNDPPKRIGRFEVRAVLGEGAFGCVFLAFDAELERQVAIKVPKLEGFTPEMRTRFVREARATARIHHPNVCPVYEVGTDGDLPFIVMHYQPGTTLAAHLDKWKVLAPLNAVALAQKLALGVAAAHEQGVIHRDLKPQNVLFEPAKQLALITDFGLARIGVPTATVDGAVCGTPAYMSPEQASGKQDAVGPHSDVYALGVILYRMLTGDVPFRGSVFEVLAQHAMAAPPPPSALRPGLDPRLDALVLKAMAKRSADRFPSAKAFAEALGEYARGGGGAGASWLATASLLLPEPELAEAEPVESRRASAVPRRRKVVWLSLGGVIAVLLVAIVVLGVRSNRPSAGPEADHTDLRATKESVNSPAVPDEAARSEAERKRLEEKRLRDEFEALKKKADAERIELDRLRAEEKRREEERREEERFAAVRAVLERKKLREAAHLVGETVEIERIRVEQRVAQAVKDYLQGCSYEDGLGVKQDLDKARELFEKSATQGNKDAQFKLGYMYFNSLGVKQDYAKAREWYEKSAAQGDKAAQNNLGVIYHNGNGVAQDHVKAREWYEKSAAQTNEFAEHNLGILYENGLGVKQDDAKAKEWYEKSAAKGHAKAQYDLGRFYENGRGVKADLARALEWYEKAAAQGFEKAKEAVVRLKKK